MKELEYKRLSDKVVADMELVKRLIDYKKVIQEYSSNLILPSEGENLRNSIKDYGLVDTIIFVSNLKLSETNSSDTLEVFLVSRAACEILKELEFEEYNSIAGCIAFSDKLEQFRNKSEGEKQAWLLNKFCSHMAESSLISESESHTIEPDLANGSGNNTS